jgi:hypothetical protein
MRHARSGSRVSTVLSSTPPSNFALLSLLFVHRSVCFLDMSRRALPGTADLGVASEKARALRAWSILPCVMSDESDLGETLPF